MILFSTLQLKGLMVGLYTRRWKKVWRFAQPFQYASVTCGRTETDNDVMLVPCNITALHNEVTEWLDDVAHHCWNVRRRATNRTVLLLTPHTLTTTATTAQCDSLSRAGVTERHIFTCRPYSANSTPVSGCQQCCKTTCCDMQAFHRFSRS